MTKQKKKKPKVYSIEDVTLAVNHWSMFNVHVEEVKQFINKEKKDKNQLELFNN